MKRIKLDGKTINPKKLSREETIKLFATTNAVLVIGNETYPNPLNPLDYPKGSDSRRMAGEFKRITAQKLAILARSGC